MGAGTPSDHRCLIPRERGISLSDGRDNRPGRAQAAVPGVLYCVATPIGNLADLSPRAADILNSADLIACEDTRVTGKLLRKLELDKPCISYREENEKALAPQLVKDLQAGKSIALVADAGTPTLSDPGFRLVRACRIAGVSVVPVPGPFAAAAALSASGLPTDGFLFVGFLPPKRAARERFFQQFLEFPYTLVCYESTHRIMKFIEDAIRVLGPERVVCVAREITKLHETFHTGTLKEVQKALATASTKGEFVVCIARSEFVLE